AVAGTLMSAPASRMINSATAPMRDAFHMGAAQGYRDADQPDSTPGSGSDASSGRRTQPEAPAWAQHLARRQRLTQAGLVASGAVREGDRPVGGGGPDLKDKS